MSTKAAKREEDFLHFVRTRSGLEAADERTREMLETWPIGQAIACDVQRERSLEKLRWWWGLCRVVLDNSDDFASLDDVSNSIKLGTGCVVTTQVYEHGEWRIERAPGSIAFRNMDETRFRELCLKAHRYVCLFLDVSKPQLRDALEEYLNPYKR